MKELTTILAFEQERSHIMSLPSVAYDKRIKKQRAQYLSYLNARNVESTMSDMLVSLRLIDRALNRILKTIEAPNESVCYDIGRHLAKQICEILKKKKRHCLACSPKID